MVSRAYNKKPLSVAVEELYASKVKILSEDDSADEDGGSEEALQEQEAFEDGAAAEDTVDEAGAEDGEDSREADQEV